MPNQDLVSVAAQARSDLADLVPLAVSTLAELAVGAERDNVRLAAAEAILDRTGVARGSTLEVTTTSEQHEEATAAAIALVTALKRNKDNVPALPSPALDTLLVLEAESDELPTSDVVRDAIEATSSP
jgi:hypothetical protein